MRRPVAGVVNAPFNRAVEGGRVRLKTVMPAPAASHAFDLSGLEVLVVDDEPVVLQTVRDMLRAMGVRQITLARDGEAALEVLDRGREPIRIIVADWNMPGKNGMELFGAVRARWPEIGFMLLTGRCDAQSVLDARSRGVDGYLKKPFSAAQLGAKLMSVNHKRDVRTGAAT